VNYNYASPTILKYDNVYVYVSLPQLDVFIG